MRGHNPHPSHETSKISANFFLRSVLILSAIYLLVGVESSDRAFEGWQQAWHSMCCQHLRIQQTFYRIGHNVVVFIQTVRTLQGHSKSHLLPQGFLLKAMQSLVLREE